MPLKDEPYIHDAPTTRRLPLPVIVVALAQAGLSFNTVSLPIALSGLVKSFSVAPTAVSAAIVMYSLAVASFVLVGAKLGKRFGSVKVFQSAVALFGFGQAIMTTSPNATVMIMAQGLCGVAGAALVPSLVVLIAKLVPKPQQATALGILGAAGALGAISALLVGGVLGTYLGWRSAFGLVTLLWGVVWVWSLRLKADDGSPNLRIDIVGATLSAIAVILISLGFSHLADWGFGLASAAAPVSFFGISPASALIVAGIVLGQAFMGWTRRRRSMSRATLFAAEVLSKKQQQAALHVVFSMGMLEAMLNFAISLYMQVVQGRSPVETAVAIIPFNLSVFIASLYAVRTYDRFSPRQLGRYGFCTCAIALFWLAIVVRNDWSTAPVIAGLALFGIAKGILSTLALNIWVAASPATLSGDVGALRGTTHNLAAAIGTALVGALLAGLLSAAVMRGVASTDLLPNHLLMQFDLDNITFVSNAQLHDALARMSATALQAEEALRINTEARLRAMKITFLIMGTIALLTIAPAGRLPKTFGSSSS